MDEHDPLALALEPGKVGQEHRPHASQGFRRARVRLGAVLALAVAVGVVAWAVVGRSDTNNSGSSNTGPQPTSPVGTKTGPLGLTAAGLRSMSASLKQPIYWAGAKPDHTYEFTRTSNGNVYVRYLPSGTKVGDKRTTFLIVVTYPLSDAYAALARAAKRQPGKTYRTPDGGLAWVGDAYPKSVHVAFRGVGYQIEVFYQSPDKALSEALSGSISPVS